MRIDVGAGLCALALTLTVPAVAAASQPTSSTSASAAEAAIARAIVSETGVIRDFMAGFEQAIAANSSSSGMPEAQRQLLIDSLREEAQAQESAIVDMFVDVLVKTYEQDELEAYLAFARTPTGKRYLARNGQFMSEVTTRSEALGQRLVPGALERFAAKMRAAGAK